MSEHRIGAESEHLGDQVDSSPIDSSPVVNGGHKEWRNSKGELHREDGPAIEYFDGAKEWYRNGELHREDGPAAEYPDGERLWFRNGKRHRKDGPAVELANGIKEWWVNGEQVDPF